MSKTFLIIKREYLTRVRKRSFIVMSLLGPLLFGGFIILYGWLTQVESKSNKSVVVIDDSGLFAEKISNTPSIKFVKETGTISEAIKRYTIKGETLILHIPADVLQNQQIGLYSNQQATVEAEQEIRHIIDNELEKLLLKETLEKELAVQKLEMSQIENILKAKKSNLQIRTIKLGDKGSGKESSPYVVMIIGYIFGLVIYMFILIYGAMVMRGVIEEKVNRIVEIVISSVRPFQLMMGKIVGIGLVGLTQFVLWIVLTLVIVGSVTAVMVAVKPTQPPVVQQQMITSTNPQMNIPANGSEKMQDVLLNSLKSINFYVMIISFIIFFITGYLLYGALFAAIGAAVDNETDVQQFMFPVTMPLILAIITLVNVIQYPKGVIAFWFSMIPLTSPIVMMVRIPYGLGEIVPVWQYILSVILLIVTSVGAVWMAAKIYRTGILIYGKKVNYRELWKWLWYRS